MKTLDRYIIKSFMVNYVIAFTVLIGLCITIDLFVNIDEFAELAKRGTGGVLQNIVSYYYGQSAVYFRYFAGVITVVAAVFSMGRMTKNNEFVALMASGVSLKRIIAPIVCLTVLLTGLLIVDQEIVIPRLAHQIIRSRDTLPGEESYKLWFTSDSNGSLICSSKFESRTQTMYNPFIIIRSEVSPQRWQVTGKIEADKAVYDHRKGGWHLINGRYMKMASGPDWSGNVSSVLKTQGMNFYKTDLTSRDIPLRQQEGYMSLLSFRQLSALAAQKSIRVKDQAQLYLQKHSRITDPVVNVVMLLLALPVLVCRDPRTMKSAIAKSFGLTSLCFVAAFVCKIFATEVYFNQIRPDLWAWTAVFIFLPVAIMELDSIKT